MRRDTNASRKRSDESCSGPATKTFRLETDHHAPSVPIPGKAKKSWKRVEDNIDTHGEALISPKGFGPSGQLPDQLGTATIQRLRYTRKKCLLADAPGAEEEAAPANKGGACSYLSVLQAFFNANPKSDRTQA